MTNKIRAISVGQTPPTNTDNLWLSTSHRHMRISQARGDRTTVISPSGTYEGVAAQEPCVWYRNGKYHMTYSAGGSGSTYLFYAYADGPLGPWTKFGRILGYSFGPSSPTGDAFHGNVYIDSGAGVGHLYLPDTTSWKAWSFSLDFTPSAGPTLTYIGVVFTPPNGISGVSGNSFVFKDTDGTYLFFYEAAYNNYQIGLATGTTPTSFTHKAIPIRSLWPNFQANGANLAVQNGSPWLFKEDDGLYVLYYHAGPNGRPTQCYRATSYDLLNWTKTDGGQPIIRRVHPLETDQTADPSVVQSPGGQWYCYWTSLQNTPTLTGGINAAPMQPTLMAHNGREWSPFMYATDSSVDKPEFISSFVATSNFTTTTVGSDVAVTGLALTYTPTNTVIATVRMRMKVASSAAGSVTASIGVSPTTVIDSAPGITYPSPSAQRDDMPASSTSFTTLFVETTLKLVANTTYTITGYVKNGTGAATTTVAFGGSVSEIELLAIPY